MLPFSVWYVDHKNHRRKKPTLCHEELGYPGSPLWYLSATEEYSSLPPLVRCMRPSPNLESSIHNNIPTPQLRKKRMKRMKGKEGQSIVIRQGDGHKAKDERGWDI
jgi:hypothetical protein